MKWHIEPFSHALKISSELILVLSKTPVVNSLTLSILHKQSELICPKLIAQFDLPLCS